MNQLLRNVGLSAVAALVVAAAQAIGGASPGAFAATRTVCPPGGASNSTVNGGVSVRPGGEIEVGASLFSGVRSPSTVRGGVRLTRPVDWDIETAHVYGGVRITGGVSALPTFCGNTVFGGMSVRDVSAANTWIGDPGETLGEEFTCLRNRIHGSLLLDNSATFVVEGNQVTGSVFLTGSTLELNGNRIGGSLFCRNGTAILPGESPDPSGNMVGGAN